MLADLPEVQPVDPAPSTSGDDRFLGVAAHASFLVLPLLGPLLAYLIARVAGAAGHGRQHAATALNFHLTMTLVIPVALIGHAALMFGLSALTLIAETDNLFSLVLATAGSFIGVFGLAAGFVLFELVCTVLGCIAAARGRPFTYPMAIPLFR